MCTPLSDEEVGQQVIEIILQLSQIPRKNLSMTASLSDLDNQIPGIADEIMTWVEEALGIKFSLLDAQVIMTCTIQKLTEIVIDKWHAPEVGKQDTPLEDQQESDGR